MLELSDNCGDLPPDGEFLRIFEWDDADCGTVKTIPVLEDVFGPFQMPDVYVRKEVLHVLSIFKSTYKDVFKSGEIVNRFVLMGSPGVGKSSLLALLSLYLAVKHQRTIIWRLDQPSEGLPPFVRVFYRGKYWEWKNMCDEDYGHLLIVIQHSNPWLFLDGPIQDYINSHPQICKFSVLAPDGHYALPASGFTERCLLPFWQKHDLRALGKHSKLTDGEIETQYFESGGNARLFFHRQARQIVYDHVVARAPESDSSVVQMYGVDDRDDEHAYVDEARWTRDVTSRYAVQCMAKHLPPDYVERHVTLIKTARTSNGVLRGEKLFAIRFFDTVFHRRVLRIECREYDPQSGDHTRHSVAGARAMTSMTWNDPNNHSRTNRLVKYEIGQGSTQADCDEMVSRWAAKPSKLDCWIPQSGLPGIPDAIVKWTPPETINPEFVMIYRCTASEVYGFDTSVVCRVGKLFKESHLGVRVLIVVLDEEKMEEFRFKPDAFITSDEMSDIPVCVGYTRDIDI
ncbi:hypothetical protein Poli38472_012793 [Pythium oligandrum]|uniref:Uncharacterized protein n=1 Tax=Pythium oligandrum TaxID=41045 RepID=A0A8K1CG89_PYTOL|nr:hypothetical protein Poli38472_012793 [Pythium oligandrum]|eukprot:TMW61602.1 hypothetical protein Poli38472_012793 [Pythium oligandrum]